MGLQADALTPGRKLDALVAEKVMGWKVIETDDCNGIDNFWLSKDGQHPYGAYILCHCGTTLQTHNENFSHWQQGHFDSPQYKTIGEEK